MTEATNFVWKMYENYISKGNKFLNPHGLLRATTETFIPCLGQCSFPRVPLLLYMSWEINCVHCFPGISHCSSEKSNSVEGK